MFSSVCNGKNFLLYLFTLRNCFVNDLIAVSKFEYQINPAQDHGFWRLELPHKSCNLKYSGNRTIIILCYFVRGTCLQNSAFTIITPSNKRPLKKLKKLINPWGLYSEYYVWNLFLFVVNSSILLKRPRTS